MKLISFNSISYPSELATNQQVEAMAKAFSDRLGENFLLVINSLGIYAGLSGVRTVELKAFGHSKTLRAAIWIVRHMHTFMNGERTIIYSKDSILCILAIILRPLFGYEVCYESHLLFGDWRDRFIANRANYIVAITHDLAKRIAILNPHVHLSIEPSGVDVDLFDVGITKKVARERLGLDQQAIIGLYTGRFTTMGMEKGIDIALQAMKLLDLRYQFIAIGGSEDDIQRYIKQADTLDLTRRTDIRGHVAQRELAIWQKAADVLLMPFPSNEHYAHFMSPLKMFEYMASGVPIIASDLPSIRDILNSSNAVLVQPGDPAALANGIRFVIDHIDEAAQRAQKAYGEVTRYSWKSRTDRIIHFLS